ncbi:MAG: lipase maturation factor family protein [Myxococcota bacterium]
MRGALLEGARGNLYLRARFLILRLLGFVYTAAFASLAWQLMPLIGSTGVTPAARFVTQLEERLGVGQAFLALPSIFFLDTSDTTLLAFAWIGLGLSVALLLGYASGLVLLALWSIYLSFVHIGQVWYGYGWEIQLAETGFLAIFLVPFFDGRPRAARAPPFFALVLFRWLGFRIMLGAGLIKLRGDACWTELSCLDTHFLTQPIPSPLSLLFHLLPPWAHRLGVLFNHLVEVGLPWLMFGPRRARAIAGLGMIAFQLTLILSGNLSFLNWLTIVPMLACFDDGQLTRGKYVPPPVQPFRWDRRAILGAVLCTLIAALSLNPVANLWSGHQVMNTSFDPLALVNTYGAFGSVGKTRDELIIEGTLDDPEDPEAVWKAYELPCKPGDPLRRPCFTGPFQRRLDWQIWFAAMGSIEDEPWMANVVLKLLRGEPDIRRLFAQDPYPGKAPRAIRVERYRYDFAPLGQEAWWIRERIGPWLPALTAEDPRLLAFVRNYGWE